MAVKANIPPLANGVPIVKTTGAPTPQFIQLWQQAIGNATLTEDAATALEAEKADKSVVITAGTGLSGGGDLSADITLDLEDTAVTPGSYTNGNFTVDAQGRLTAASNGAGGGGWTLVNTTTIAAPVAVVDIVGLAGAGDILIIGQDLVSSVAGLRAFRVSTDNGATFFAGAADYRQVQAVGGLTNAAQISLHTTNATAARTGIGMLSAANTTSGAKFINLPQNIAGLFVGATGPVNAVRVFNFGGGNLTAGTIYVFTR